MITRRRKKQFYSVHFKLKVEHSNMDHSMTGTMDAIIESKPEVHHLPRSNPILDATDLSDTTESEAEKHACM